MQFTVTNLVPKGYLFFCKYKNMLTMVCIMVPANSLWSSIEVFYDSKFTLVRETMILY